LSEVNVSKAKVHYALGFPSLWILLKNSDVSYCCIFHWSEAVSAN